MEYNCEKCHYFTKVKCNFAKHMASKKHSLDTQLPYICKCLICAKQYKSISGLWRHNKKHKSSIVENSESLQISIKKEPDKLVENHDNDRSTEEKTNDNKKNKPKTQKKYRIQSYNKTKRRRRKNFKLLMEKSKNKAAK